MIEYIVRRPYQSILVLLAVTVIVFFLLYLSGDPVLMMLPIDTPIEEIESFRKEMGFDKPSYRSVFSFS